MVKVPFSEKELIPVGRYGEGPMSVFKYDTPITPRENFIRAIRRQNPLWVPMKSDTLIFNPSVYPDNVARAFVLEGKPYKGEVGGADIFGVKWKFVPVVGGSMVEPGNPIMKDVNDWKEIIKFPDIDSWDWKKSAEENKEFLNTDLLKITWIFNGMFERLISFMDFEAAVMALIDEDQQDAVHELFQALTDFYKNLIHHFKIYYNPDMIYFHDDWGSQRSPFFSLETCREMIVPYIKQIVDYCHKEGMFFEFHCCGKDEMLVPTMIECGMDVWGGQPLNDKKMLADTYGDKIMIGVHDLLTTISAEERAKLSDEEILSWARDFVNDYVKNMPEKAVYVMDLFPNEKLRSALYEMSRKALYQKL